jgi:hypothetical protein
MIIPLALDISEHDYEYIHDITDFKILSRILRHDPILLLCNSDKLQTSELAQQIAKLPIKYRDLFKEIFQRLLHKSVSDWDGKLNLVALDAIKDTAQVVAMSRAKFCLEFDFTEDTDVEKIDAYPNLECTLFKAIQHTTAYNTMQNLSNGDIDKGILTREQIWNDRFAPVVSATKWSQIKLVDRYLFKDEDPKSGPDFHSIDFLLKKLNTQLSNPSIISIYVQNNMYKSTRNGFDYYPEIVDHLAKITESMKNISEIKIYGSDKEIMKERYHHRFFFFRSKGNDSILYAYDFDTGFGGLFSSSYISKVTKFDFNIHLKTSNCDRYEHLSDIERECMLKPEYSKEKIRTFITKPKYYNT